MYSINCAQITVSNDKFYSTAPKADANESLLPFQIVSEAYTTQKKIHMWIYRSQQLHYILGNNLVDMIGEVMLLNLNARTEVRENTLQEQQQTVYNNWQIELMREALENTRIFTLPFVELIRNTDLYEAAAVDSDPITTQDINTNLASYHWNENHVLLWANWLPITTLIQTLDTTNIRALANISHVIPDRTLFMSYPECLDGLSSILQPWIIDQLRVLINESIGLSVTAAPIDLLPISSERVFKDVFTVVSDFGKLGAKTTVARLDMRHIILPFMQLARIDDTWIRNFVDMIFKQDLSKVISSLNSQLRIFRNNNIDPTAIADMIVFLFGGVLNATKDTLESSGRRRNPQNISNTIYNQLRYKSIDQSLFYITKIRTAVFDPIFLIAQRHLAQACNTTHLPAELKFRKVNLLYSPEEKLRLLRLIQDRQRATDERRNFVDGTYSRTENFICHAQKEIRRIPKEHERQIIEMDFGSIIKYPSSQTFNPDNCASASVQFLKNMDAYSTLFSELVIREMFGVNNVICSVRPIITNPSTVCL